MKAVAAAALIRVAETFAGLDEPPPLALPVPELPEPAGGAGGAEGGVVPDIYWDDYEALSLRSDQQE